MSKQGYKATYKGEQAGFELADSLTDFIIKLAGGNPGALTALLQVSDDEKIKKIDPSNSILGPLAYLLDLDSFGIYREKIWMLYKDVCRENILYFVAMIRALQLGLVDRDNVYYAIENRGACLDLEQILSDVKRRLPRFGQSMESEDTIEVDELSSDEREEGIFALPSQWVEPYFEQISSLFNSYLYNKEHDEL